jgi:membrane associated rhomboid family serine protease
MFKLRQQLDAQWQRARQQLMLVLLWTGVLWAVFIIDWALPLDLRGWGIRPRTLAGLPAIAAAPFLHVHLWHLMANTLPLVMLGWITVMSGRVLFLKVCLVTALSSGTGAWCFGTSGQVHEGASGVVFGLLGFLLTRGWFSRRLLWTLTSLGVGLFYLGSVLSLLRADQGISWSSHFWGFAGGTAMAWWLYGRKAAAGTAPAAAPRVP